MACARVATRRADSIALNLVAGFAAAFVGYEGALYLASFALGGETDAYAASVIVEILWTNGLAFVGLLAIHRLATRAGFAPARLAPAGV